MRVTLHAIAKHTGVSLRQSIHFVRHNPLFEEEVSLEEELIRLEEAIQNYHLAADTLGQYPSMRKHLIKERRTSVQHTIGLIARMMLNRPLPREYTAQDTRLALRRLARLVALDARLGGYKLEKPLLELLTPLLTIRQKYHFGVLAYNPWHYLRRISIPV